MNYHYSLDTQNKGLVTQKLQATHPPKLLVIVCKLRESDEKRSKTSVKVCCASYTHVWEHLGGHLGKVSKPLLGFQVQTV
eukprot:3542681-Amphidinium_carterae.2